MATATTGISASLGTDQFLQLLVTQLQNQDPLNPVNDQQFIAQLTSLSQLQGIQNLNTSFAEQLKLQQLTQGTSLIGKTVDYTTTVNGQTVTNTGKVASLAVDGDKIVLAIGPDRVKLDQIANIRV
jgi:flagellar basal-body rod modification protein FlgD